MEQPPREMSSHQLGWSRRLGGVIGAVAILGTIALVDVGLLRVVNDTFERETADHLRTTALMGSQLVRPEDVEALRVPADVNHPSFKRLHATLLRLRSVHRDVTWVYVMRYLGRDDQWAYVGDAEPFALDRDGNGTIDAGERAVYPGDLFAAGEANEAMLAGLEASVANMTPVPDPTYGKSVSGYAPIRDAQGHAIAVLGVDVMVELEASKLEAVTVALLGGSVVIAFLLIYTLYLFRRRTIAFGRAEHLQERLGTVQQTYAKFVPENVRRELEHTPDGSSLERKELDVTVMFVDLAGYTRMSERLAGESLGALLEKYFSRYLEVIHRCHGQVNETAGDGLMVIFQGHPPVGHALDAVQAAVEIEHTTWELNEGLSANEEHVIVNIGINSGTAFVGLNKFVGFTGERYTYTATGPTTNVAARIAGLAKEGDILMSEATAERVKAHVDVERVGRRTLKNVGRPIMIFRPMGSGRSGRVDPVVAAARS